MLKINLFVLSLAGLIFAGSAIAQPLNVGDKDEEGRTFLFNELIEEPYWTAWSGIRVRGDGSDETGVYILAEGKAVFEGVLSLYCNTASDHEWTLGNENAGVVPAKVTANARKLFCGR